MEEAAGGGLGFLWGKWVGGFVLVKRVLQWIILVGMRHFSLRACLALWKSICTARFDMLKPWDRRLAHSGTAPEQQGDPVRIHNK